MREIVSPLSGIRSPFGQLSSPLAIYAVLGIKPQLVFDFDDEKYFTGSSRTTFTSAITHSRTSNATMVDSDGLLKWAPHNLLTYSEQFDNAAWVKSGAAVDGSTGYLAPDGTNTADRVSYTASTIVIYQNATVFPGSEYTFSFWAKNNGGLRAEYRIRDLTNGPDIVAINTSYFSLINSSEWSLIEVSFTAPAGCTTISAYPVASTGVDVSDPVDLLLWGAHVYRSDLGGMVNNPDRNDSYVPTTSSARYLPRRGHHVWNGSAWVNEGVLHESEARTNLLTYSSEFDNAAWGKSNATITANVTVAPDGTSTADKLVEASGTVAPIIFNSSANVLPGSVSAARGIYVKSAGDSRFLQMAMNDSVGGNRVLAVINPDTGQTAVASGVTASSILVGNGWYFFSVSFTSGATTNNAQIRLIDSLTTASASYAADGTSGIYIWGAQLEAGSTPSSYIPTAGAAVTRAAETLTIPAANLPWPTVNVIGPELVTNGGFATNDLTGWTDTSTGTGTVDASSGAAALLGTDASNRGKIEQAVSVTAGKLYRVTFDVVRNSGALGTGFITTSGAVPIATYEVTSGSKEYLLVAPAGAQYFAVTTHAGGGDATIDNISVREIDPLAVSIQMQGKMTLADENVADVAQLYRWYAGASGYIVLNADAATVGAAVNDSFRFVQNVPSVTDTVSSADGSLPFGILAPFNIASRHGSTFINGAVDGVALTANTTPTALPDLSATDLNLGYDYMGTIKLFRIWAADLADAGIAEAST